MPSVEFEPTISVFERAKTVHALNRAATMICHFTQYYSKIQFYFKINSLFVPVTVSLTILETMPP
jgi:hypothetical protein